MFFENLQLPSSISVGIQEMAKKVLGHVTEAMVQIEVSDPDLTRVALELSSATKVLGFDELGTRAETKVLKLIKERIDVSAMKLSMLSSGDEKNPIFENVRIPLFVIKNKLR